MKPDIDKTIKINENDFFSDFEKSTEEFEQPEIKLNAEPAETKENGILKSAIKKTNKLAAKTLINSADNILALLLSLYALSNETDNYKLNQSELADLIELVESMMPEQRFFLPEWLLALIGISTIYTAKIKQASRERKENFKKQKLEDAKYKKELKEYEENDETED